MSVDKILNLISMMSYCGIEIEFKPNSKGPQLNLFTTLVKAAYECCLDGEPAKGEYILELALEVYSESWIAWAAKAEMSMESNFKNALEHVEKARKLYENEFGLDSKSCCELNEIQLTILLLQGEFEKAFEYASEATKASNIDFQSLKAKILIELELSTSLSKKDLTRIEDDINYLISLEENLISNELDEKLLHKITALRRTSEKNRQDLKDERLRVTLIFDGTTTLVSELLDEYLQKDRFRLIKHVELLEQQYKVLDI